MNFINTIREKINKKSGKKAAIIQELETIEKKFEGFKDRCEAFDGSFELEGYLHSAVIDINAYLMALKLRAQDKEFYARHPKIRARAKRAKKLLKTAAAHIYFLDETKAANSRIKDKLPFLFQKYKIEDLRGRIDKMTREDAKKELSLIEANKLQLSNAIERRPNLQESLVGLVKELKYRAYFNVNDGSRELRMGRGGSAEAFVSEKFRAQARRSGPKIFKSISDMGPERALKLHLDNILGPESISKSSSVSSVIRMAAGALGRSKSMKILSNAIVGIMEKNDEYPSDSEPDTDSRAIDGPS